MIAEPQTTTTTSIMPRRAKVSMNPQARCAAQADSKNKSNKVTASAPGKAILFGEHFVIYGTDAIICAINRRVHVTASKSEKIQIRSNIGSFEADSYAQYASDVGPLLRPLYHIAKESARVAKSNSGITLDIKSDIPPGAGLGSSSACCVAGAAAALRMHGTCAQTDDIIKLAIAAERTVFPNASGADTAASTLGGIITYNTKSGYSRTIPAGCRPGFRLVVADSGIAHNTEKVVGHVSAFREANPAGFADLCAKETQVISDVTETLREDVQNMGPGHHRYSKVRGRNSNKNDHMHDGKSSKHTASRLGSLASLNQGYLCDIGISNQDIDAMIEAINGTTYGSKITGAGSGGCIIAFVDEKTGASSRNGGTDTAGRTVSHMAGRGYDCFVADIDNEGLNTF